MKILILCGGLGTRLAGTVGDLPKPMIPLGGRPLVWHIMKGLAHAGFCDFVLCLGYRSELIRQYFLNLPLMIHDVTIGSGGAVVNKDEPDGPMEWVITLADTGLDSMTGARVKRAAAKYVPPSDDIFGVTYGDGVTDLDFRKVVAFHRSHGRMATVTAVHPPGRFGELALTDAGAVRQFNEKPQAEGGWISGGFFVFNRTILERLSDDSALMLEEEPLQRLAADGELVAYRHPDFWMCVDTPRDYRQLSELWQQGRAPWALWDPQR